MNGRRKGRSPWRLAAFADHTGLICYHTFLGLWPTDEWSPTALSAVLNGPLASAYIATHTIGRDVPIWAVKRIPLPRLDTGLVTRIERLVGEYIGLVQGGENPASPERTAARVLLEIDAAVLEGYDLSPRLERRLLDYFRGYGERRPVSHTFGDYYPADFKPYFHLSEYLSEEFRQSTAGRLRALQGEAPQDVLDALQAAVEAYAE